MSWIMFILFGFVIGLLARAIVPGKQKLGILWTVLLGVAGSLLGGLATNAFAGESIATLDTAGFLGSLAGAVILLWIYATVVKRRAGTGKGGGPPRPAH